MSLVKKAAMVAGGEYPCECKAMDESGEIRIGPGEAAIFIYADGSQELVMPRPDGCECPEDDECDCETPPAGYLATKAIMGMLIFTNEQVEMFVDEACKDEDSE